MRQFFQLLIPQKAETILSLTLGVLILSLLNIQRFWLILGGDDSAQNAAEHSSWDNLLTNAINVLDSHINPNWLDILMWLLIGCLGFLVFSFITGSIKAAEEEVELVHYFTNPNGRHHEILVFISKLVVRVVGILGSLLWVSIFFELFMPFCSKLFFTAVTSLPEAIYWLWLVIAIGMFAAGLYLFAILARLVALKTRIL